MKKMRPHWRFLPGRFSGPHKRLSQWIIPSEGLKLEVSISDNGVYFTSQELRDPLDILFSKFKHEDLNQLAKRAVLNIERWLNNSTRLARYERGEDVPLSELPEELRENVEDPPESVLRIRKRMMDKKAKNIPSFRDFVPLLQQRLPTGAEFQLVQSKFRKGDSGKGMVRLKFQTGIPMLNLHFDISFQGISIRYEVNNPRDRQLIVAPTSQALSFKNALGKIVKNVKQYMKANSGFERGFRTPPHHPGQRNL